MLIENIVVAINTKLAGERCSYAKLRPYMDSVIDDINSQMNTIFPAFTELPAAATEYNAFPDKYIRSVVTFGAAYYFYQTDEEGIDSANAYLAKYKENMFYMFRDYLAQVPEMYQAPDTNGAVMFNPTGAVGEGIYGIDFSNTRI
jgi:hypothetical protein